MNRGNILIIDDGDKLRVLLKRIISAREFTVFEADDLKSGLFQLEHEAVDVIICDVKLPDGNGLQFLEKVKKDFRMLK